MLLLVDPPVYVIQIKMACPVVGGHVHVGQKGLDIFFRHVEVDRVEISDDAGNPLDCPQLNHLLSDLIKKHVIR